MKNFGGETLSKTHPKTLCNGNPTPRGLILSCFGGVAIFIPVKAWKMTLVCMKMNLQVILPSWWLFKSQKI